MKPIHIFLLFLSLPALVVAQLEGEYCSQGTLGGECFTFERNNRFSYHTWNNCMIHSYGDNRGCWSINKQELTLLFDQDTFIYHHYREIRTSTNSDSIQLKFTITDRKTRDSLEGALIRFFKALDQPVIAGMIYSPEFGNTYKFPKSADSIAFVIGTVGYASFIYKCKLDANYDFDILLEEGNYKPLVLPQKWVYDIENTEDPNLLRLIRKGGELVETFKKIKPKK